MAKDEKMTRFRSLYEIEKGKPTPAQAFVKKCAELCCKDALTVRLWIKGTRKPDPLCRKVLAEFLGENPETLFEEEVLPF